MISLNVLGVLGVLNALNEVNMSMEASLDCWALFSNFSFSEIMTLRLFFANAGRDRRTDRPTDGRTDPHIEMRGRI